ncbi:hypothetical protein SPISAL_02030 [Spiribacter salinus M19-40]|uniref:WxL domain-containing protein n=1 Tax=Spiribacter salinus M19-40 TaxID=1260251 RepID=R4VLL2_9GAMM|nr:hypothetical protein [Spiribacter salinus]AGM40503.1 hypothetical protein SPISAL_02030 [Spiribacter salinus M19-40]
MRCKQGQIIGLLGIALSTIPLTAIADEEVDQTITFNVEEVSMLAMSGGDSVKLELINTDLSAGEDPRKSDSNDSTQLQYTVLTDDDNRNITIEADGDLPPGFDITAGVSNIPGEGQCGTAQTGIDMTSKKTQTLISDVGTCWTGTGTGAQVAYSISPTGGTNGVAELNASDEYSMDVMYTLGED